MQEIPMQPIANQAFQVQLGGQPCLFEVYQSAYGLFMNLSVGASGILNGQICQNLNRLVRGAYLGFVGNLCFVDTQGGGDPQDPVYTGLGSRFRLIYLEATDANSGS